MKEKKDKNPTFRVTYFLIEYHGRNVWSGDLEAFLIDIVEKGATKISIRVIGYE